jgi:hypothetical protein
MSIGVKSYSDGSGGAIQALGIDIFRVAQTGTVGEASFLGGVSENVQGTFSTTLAGTVTLPVDSGTVYLGATGSSISSWAFTNVPVGNSKAVTVTVVISANASFTYADPCTVNGASISGGVRWSGGSAPSPSSNTDILTFVIIKDSSGSTRVFGFAAINLG